MQNKKLLLVVNPTAGQKRAIPFIPSIARLYSDNGYDTVLYVTNARGDAARKVKESAAGYDRIVCIGGDGTLNEVLSGLVLSGAKVPVGYIPAGTTNDFASTLSLSTDIMAAAKDSISDTVTGIDLGSFNGRTFIYIASFGAFTRASYSTPQAVKNALGHLAYILEGVREITSLSPVFTSITAPDGTRYAGEYLFGSISNSRSVAGLIKLESDIVSLNDGQFEVMLIRAPRDLIELNDLLSAVKRGRPGESSLVTFFTASSLDIHCPNGVAWTLDGEDAGVQERIIFSVLPCAASIAREARA